MEGFLRLNENGGCSVVAAHWFGEPEGREHTPAPPAFHFSLYQRRGRLQVKLGNTEMTTTWDKFIENIECRKRQLDEVVDAYKNFRQKIESLPPDLAREAAALLGISHPISNQVAPAEVPTSKDLIGKNAMECVRIILGERENQPMHYSQIAKEAINRGYQGRTEGTKEEVEVRTGQSFWAAMSRSDDLESIGKGYYKLREESSESNLEAYAASDSEISEQGDELADDEAAPESPKDADSIDQDNIPGVVISTLRGLEDQDTPIEKGVLIGSIRTIIKEMPFQHFSILSIFTRLRQKGLKAKKSSIRPVLRKLVQLGEIVEIRHGIGRSPSLYKRRLVDEKGPA